MISGNHRGVFIKIALALCLFIATVSVCYYLYRDYISYRYRLTVELYEDGIVRRGHSVVQVDEWQSETLVGNQINSKIIGEAVVVQLSGERRIYALLKSVNGLTGGFASAALGRDVGGSAHSVEWPDRTRRLKYVKHVGSVPENSLPTFVYFSNEQDPSSIEVVDPKDFPRKFGNAVTLKGVFVKITDDPVTVGISERFSWWDYYKNRHFDGSSASITNLRAKNASAKMTSRSFSTGISE